MTKTTAQEASGSTIVSADNPRLDRFGHAHALTRPIAAPEEAVDADRDRGTPRDVAPPTPPGIRVRTTAVRPVKRSRCLEIRQAE